MSFENMSFAKQTVLDPGIELAPETTHQRALPPEPANSPLPTVPVRPFAARPRLPDGGLRLMPLDGFVWNGGRTPAGSPKVRVRGDHCLIRVTDGSIRIVLPSGAIDHGPGSVIFVPAGTAFATQPLTDAAGQVLLMPRGMADQLGAPLPRTIVVGAGASDAFSADLAALAQRGQDPIAAATAACRVELIAAALHRVAADPSPDRPVRPGHHARDIVERFLDLGGRELGRGRTLADLAEALGTTAAGLDEACLNQRGRSALELIYDLRLARARRLLADPAMGLARIATDLGFTGVAHLNRAFMAATGRPATAFRA